MVNAREKAGAFFSDDALAATIIGVAEGGRLRCAVAFWTENGISRLFPGGVPENAQIVCDISMGATSAEALIAMGAPNNPSLRHAYRMHAKVFISADGMVAASANVTGSALGDDDGGIRNSEAGIFHPAGSPAWTAAAAWFDRFFRGASHIGKGELALAKALYRPRAPVMQHRLPRPGSLLDLIYIAPEKFDGIGFAFTGESTTPDQMKEVRQRVARMSGDAAKNLKSLPDDGIYYGWDEPDVKRWPSLFLEFWQSSKRLHVSGRRLEYRIPDLGSIMSVKNLRAVKAACGVDLPRVGEVGSVDADLALRIRGEDSIFFANGAELAARIAEIEADDR